MQESEEVSRQESGEESREEGDEESEEKKHRRHHPNLTRTTSRRGSCHGPGAW